MIIEFITDPNVPPRVSTEQTLAYLRALTKGDPDGWKIVAQSAKQLCRSGTEPLRSRMRLNA